MSDWNPALYLRFADERTRPAAELLARVPLQSPARVVDLGCGPGNSTGLLVQRFPRAEVLGLDSSAAMVQAARERLPQAAFVQQDIAAWAGGGDGAPAPDLVYSNAALHWVDGHGNLFARLLNRLAPGGVLAVQMPDNLNEPSHRLMREVAALPSFAPLLAQALQVRAGMLAPEAYYDVLAGQRPAAIDLWHTVYRHVMDGPQAIVDWLRATGLRPFLDALPPQLQSDFLAEYGRRIDAAYGERADGRRLLAFPRLFIVAQRKP
ncbi:trans-aconitate 2-methyltransferase [Comamonas badia]|uniref:trans-aconitate 2-methyltransferase n=1 Tax=Comamonas badia TaxID=265291 RepID=UPI000424DE59|nr:trans-aconitate 2-methyltransferase [Comamonas badia]